MAPQKFQINPGDKTKWKCAKALRANKQTITPKLRICLPPEELWEQL